ncbi:hypothetical protein SUGI_0509220 [Cryptomeria japonica]|nr:hypothetical protein SUGI_0509220 [Cryptomeria japonica]
MEVAEGPSSNAGLGKEFLSAQAKRIVVLFVGGMECLLLFGLSCKVVLRQGLSSSGCCWDLDSVGWKQPICIPLLLACVRSLLLLRQIGLIFYLLGEIEFLLPLVCLRVVWFPPLLCWDLSLYSPSASFRILDAMVVRSLAGLKSAIIGRLFGSQPYVIVIRL